MSVNINNPFSTTSSSLDGGVRIVGIEYETNTKNESSASEKHAAIIEYLKELRADEKVSMEDIADALEIDLDDDINVLDMLKSNPKVEVTIGDDQMIYFQYSRPYQIRDVIELKEKIKKVRTGIAFDDVDHCYDDITNDCKALIVGGEDIIACKNTDKKTFVMYPRGKAFYTRLSGQVTARPGSSHIRTAENLQAEIRRGDAICVHGSWYRVSSLVGRGSEREQTQRSMAPLSVTSDKEMSDKNVYYDPYTHEILPLDGSYDGAGNTAITDRAKRHGCSNDIRKLWHDSLLPVKKFRVDEEVEDELLRLGLISSKAQVEVAVKPPPKPEKKKWKRWGKK